MARIDCVCQASSFKEIRPPLSVTCRPCPPVECICHRSHNKNTQNAARYFRAGQTFSSCRCAATAMATATATVAAAQPHSRSHPQIVIVFFFCIFCFVFFSPRRIVALFQRPQRPHSRQSTTTAITRIIYACYFTL